jgi:hypothetical protein
VRYIFRAETITRQGLVVPHQSRKRYKRLLGHFGIKVPGPPTEYGPPEWIGTRIEYIYTKQLPNYKPQTTLVQTDKPANGDYAVLRNVDQDLSKIKRGRKNNSGNYEVSIRRTLQEKTPVCLEIYGQRLPEKSEFQKYHPNQ